MFFFGVIVGKLLMYFEKETAAAAAKNARIYQNEKRAMDRDLKAQPLELIQFED